MRHTGPGSTIEVGSALEGDEARLWVRDSGPGIPPEDQDRIFQRFSRAQDGARRAGTAGLGLAIVRAIALAHGGRVAVDSTPGAGATFTIALPVEPVDGGDFDEDVPHEIHPKGPPP